MVVAGPGTGKTQILTLRIANILRKTDVGASSILALTFTESAAYSMRRRLVEIIGSDAYRVNIYTFHGFANEIISKYPEEFERIVGSRNISEVDQIRILKEILDNGEFKLIRPYGDPYYYLSAAAGSIRELKREDISPESFKELVEKQKQEFKKAPDLYHTKGVHKGKMKGKWQSFEKSIHKNSELLKLYDKYQKELQKRKLYDFEDMIMETVRVLEKNQNLLLELQEKYQYILADEHQDTNSAQNKILELVASFHENPNLFVVGDEKQAIFRFQGASLENFLYFKKKYAKAQVIFLSKNYRSGQEILDASMSVINKDNDKDAADLRKNLEAHNKWRSKIRFYRLEREVSEYALVATDIQKRIKSGALPSEIAILYRDNKDAVPISAALRSCGIAHKIESNQNLLEDPFVWRIITLLRAVNNISDNRLLAEALYLDIWNIPTFYVHKIIAESNKFKKDIFEVINSTKFLKTPGEESLKIKNVAEKLEYFAQIARNKHLLETLQIINQESGLLNMILKNGRHDLEKFETFFEEARKASGSRAQYKLSDFLDYIDLLSEHNISIKKNDTTADGSVVRLMTAHRSKGQEFEYVYITGVNEGHWGNKRNSELFKLPIMYKEIDDPNRDERKLFYVALTRAKKECVLTSHAISNEGKNILPSEFVGEIDARYLTIEKIPKGLEETHKQVALNHTDEISLGLLEREYLLSIFREKGLSVSAVNNYLECPLQFLFLNLIRLPQSPNKFQHYGNAVHDALAQLFALIERGKPQSKKIFLAIFNRILAEKPLSNTDFKELTEKGKLSLSQYYDANISKWKKAKGFSELNIAGVFLKDEESGIDILLRGRLDRVELKDGYGVRVIDFKTSKPKSRKEILGETHHGNGNLIRQLVFYKILLDSYEQGSYKMTTGTISFTETDEKGRLRDESFDINDEQVHELRAEIIKIAQEISDLSFLNKGCNKKSCEYCKIFSLLPKGE